MSKCKYVKQKNMIVTASRGRAVKVCLFLDSFGRYLIFGEISRVKWKNKDKFK